jgi:hypothetical protein
MTPIEKTIQLTQDGDGYATAINSPVTGNPFVVVAATADDLMDILTLQCGLPPELLSPAKFRRVVIRFPKQDTE